MSVNYYHRKTGDTSKAWDKEHIGLSSGGMFIFQSYPEKGITSFSAWRKRLEDSSMEIVTEYQEAVSLAVFEKFVGNFRNLDRAAYNNSPVMSSKKLPKGFERYLDDDGYLFWTANFS